MYICCASVLLCYDWERRRILPNRPSLHFRPWACNIHNSDPLDNSQNPRQSRLARSCVLHAEARRRHNNYDFHSACRLSPPVNRQLHLRVCTAAGSQLRGHCGRVGAGEPGRRPCEPLPSVQREGAWPRPGSQSRARLIITC